MKNQRIGIYSLYLDTLGGGERYVFTLSAYLQRENQVFLFGDKRIVEKVNERFKINLTGIKFIPPSLIAHKNTYRKLSFLRSFDTLFYMTDGSLFISPCRKNILFVQSPAHIPARTFVNKLKLINWKIVCNSIFTQSHLQRKLGISSVVVYPPVDTGAFGVLRKKEKIIITVGRFFSPLHNKKQELLIEIFKKNYQTIFKRWRLLIIGGANDKESAPIIDKLIKISSGFPIEIKVNISLPQLRFYYAKAKIYWHAAGFGEDIQAYPEKAEHFGITTVEAMAAKAVPVVYASGGQREIITEGQDGFLWRTPEELIERTEKIITSEQIYQRMSVNAKKKAEEFSQKKFYEKIENLIS